MNLSVIDTGTVATTLMATNIAAGTYYVGLRARWASGTGAASNEVLVTVGGACASPPNAPRSLGALVSGGSVTLNWQVPSGGCPPTAYLFEAGSGPGLSDVTVFSTGNPATTFSANGVSSGTYYLRVKSANAAGTSGPSNEIRVLVGSVVLSISTLHLELHMPVVRERPGSPIGSATPLSSRRRD